MFLKGSVIKDKDGIDITLKNNPEHVLAPDDESMEIRARIDLVSPDDYRKHYLSLLRNRWETRKPEFIDLAKQGISDPVHLNCYCARTSKTCHSVIASEFMNSLVERLRKTPTTNE